MTSITPWLDGRAKIEAANLLDPSLIEWPNEPFTQPDPAASPVWLSVRDVGEALEPIELGGRTYRETGRFFFIIMAAAGTGTEAARTLAKTITNAFRNLPPQPVVYMGGSIGSGAIADEQGNWWAIPVTVEWKYEDQQ